MESEHEQHDSTYKSIFGDPVMLESLLRAYIPKEFVDNIDFSSLTPLPGSYVSHKGKQFHDDLVWRIGMKNGSSCYVALLLEFQSTQDKWMPLRILNYTSLLLLDLIDKKQLPPDGKIPPVFPIVMYNGKHPWTVPTEVAPLFGPVPEILKPYCPQQQYFLLDEGSVPDEMLNESNEPVSDVIKLERAHTPEQLKEIIDRIYHLTDPKYDNFKRIFSAWIRRVIQRTGIIKAMPDLQDLQEIGAMLMENAPNWKYQYINQGREEGRGEGRGEGLGLALRYLLEDRFGSLPESVSSFIDNSSDSVALKKCILYAPRAESLQAVIDQIKVMTGTDCTGQTIQPA